MFSLFIFDFLTYNEDAFRDLSFFEVTDSKTFGLDLS